MSPGASARRHAKRAVIMIAGSAVLLVGVVLLALPGPGMIVIIIGLLILAQEFAWAERLLDIAVEKAAAANSKAQSSAGGKAALAASGLVLIVAGIAVIVFFSEYLIVGISLIFGGVIGLCTLLPQVHHWVEERARIGINATDDA